MKELFKFLRKLFSSSNEASMRRFIAFVLLVPYVIGILIGFKIAYTSSNYNFFLTSILASGIPIMLAYFLLTWEHVLEISKNIDIVSDISKPSENIQAPPEQVIIDPAQI